LPRDTADSAGRARRCGLNELQQRWPLRPWPSWGLAGSFSVRVSNGMLDAIRHKDCSSHVAAAIFTSSSREADSPQSCFEAGLAASSLSWARVQPLLAEHSSTTSYDRAGLGWSTTLYSQPSLAQMLDDLHAVVAWAGGGEPVVLVGHSFGALPLLVYTQRFPQHVAGLTVACGQFKVGSVAGGLGASGFGRPPKGFSEAPQIARATIGARNSSSAVRYPTAPSVPAQQIRGQSAGDLPGQHPVHVLRRQRGLAAQRGTKGGIHRGGGVHPERGGGVLLDPASAASSSACLPAPLSTSMTIGGTSLREAAAGRPRRR